TNPEQLLDRLGPVPGVLRDRLDQLPDRLNGRLQELVQFRLAPTGVDSLQIRSGRPLVVRRGFGCPQELLGRIVCLESGTRLPGHELGGLPTEQERVERRAPRQTPCSDLSWTHTLNLKEVGLA